MTPDRSGAGQLFTRQGISLGSIPMSPWGPDHIFDSTVHLGVGRRVVSEGSIAFATTSLLIVRTRRIVTTIVVPRDSRGFQHTADSTHDVAAVRGSTPPARGFLP
jgi:hypothetical protein